MSKVKTQLSDEVYEILDWKHEGLISEDEAERMINELDEDLAWSYRDMLDAQDEEDFQQEKYEL